MHLDDQIIEACERESWNKLYVAGVVKKYPEYNFDAKVYDRGSKFGIKGGRISKLTIRRSGVGLVANYDRGWDVKPRLLDLRTKQALKLILRAFPEETAA